MNAWVIDEERSTPSDHEVVVFDLTILDKMVDGMVTSQEVSGWSIRTLSEDNRKKTATV